MLVRPEAVGVSVALVRMLQPADAGSVQRPGGELVGTVVAVGPGVDRFGVGDRVGGVAGDVFAELSVCDPCFLSEVPSGIDAADALTLVRGGLIALSALRAGGFRAGESLLVTAAASGTGHLAVQLAKAHGASRVVAVLGEEPTPAGAGEAADPKAELAPACGADEVHRYAAESWGAPVDLVLDAAGGPVTQRGVDALAARGRLVALAANSGPVDTGSLLGELKTVTGFSIGPLSREDPAGIERTRAELWQLHADKQLRPAHHRFPFERVAEAIALVAARGNAGRVVLRGVGLP